MTRKENQLRRTTEEDKEEKRKKKKKKKKKDPFDVVIHGRSPNTTKRKCWCKTCDLRRRYCGCAVE